MNIPSIKVYVDNWDQLHILQYHQNNDTVDIAVVFPGLEDEHQIRHNRSDAGAKVGGLYYITGETTFPNKSALVSFFKAGHYKAYGPHYCLSFTPDLTPPSDSVLIMEISVNEWREWEIKYTPKPDSDQKFLIGFCFAGFQKDVDLRQSHQEDNGRVGIACSALLYDQRLDSSPLERMVFIPTKPNVIMKLSPTNGTVLAKGI